MRREIMYPVFNPKGNERFTYFPLSLENLLKVEEMLVCTFAFKLDFIHCCPETLKEEQ